MKNKLIKNKKGIFFTLIAIGLLGLVLYSYSVTYAYSMQEKTAVIETRIDTMNRLIKEIDSDMENAIYIVSYRAIISMEDYVANTGTFVDNTQNTFKELFINGTIDGQNQSLMENNTIKDWMRKINASANAIGVYMNINIENVSIRQASPWKVKIEVNATINLSDIKATANWTQDKQLSTEISIIGFEDPWYTVYTNGNVLKRINKTIYEGNYTNNATGDKNLRDHVDKTMYANWTGAPSFLMRFENNFNKSIYGIESFVNKTEVSPYYSCPTETSSIDNIYWQCNVSIGTYKIADWPGFRIDNETDQYNNTRVYRYMTEDYIIT